MDSIKVVLIKGGMGAERDVSLVTGQAFEGALKKLGYEYLVIDAQEDLPQRLAESKADVALLALHGKYAEDGVVQGLCEYLKIPYTGSGVLASALCMDKYFSKQIYMQNDIPTADYQVFDFKENIVGEINRTLELPVVVKPSREGSSVGISIVKNEQDFIPALELASQYDSFVLVEEYIPGKEITVPVLEGRALTPIEIQPKLDFYDYKNKYTAGNTDYFLPARVSDEIIEKVKKIAVQTYEACRIESYARIDFRVTDDGSSFVMEANTLPGFTPTSLFPMSAKHEGIEFDRLIDMLIKGARLDYEGVR